MATVAIDAMKFLHPIAVGDEVSCFCSWADGGATSIKVKVETWTRIRGGKEAEKVTEGCCQSNANRSPLLAALTLCAKPQLMTLRHSARAAERRSL